MKMEELDAIKVGADLANILPYAKAEIEQIQRGIVNSVLSDIRSATLTPSIALQRWIEYASYTRLLQRFEQKVRIGQSVGEKIGSDLDFA